MNTKLSIKLRECSSQKTTIHFSMNMNTCSPIKLNTIQFTEMNLLSVKN